MSGRYEGLKTADFNSLFYSNANNFLSAFSVCSWQTGVSLMAGVVVVFFFFSTTVKQKVCLLMHNAYLKPVKKGGCQDVLCNLCNPRGGVARGRREAGAGVGRLVQNRHTPHTYGVPNRQGPFQHAKPDVALWFMRGAGAARRGAEAECCSAEWLGCLHSNGSPLCV